MGIEYLFYQLGLSEKAGIFQKIIIIEVLSVA